MVRHDGDTSRYRLPAGEYQGIEKRVLAGPRDGYPGYMREFSLDPGGSTPHHSHDWYHLVYVVAGSGTATIGDREEALETGSVVFVEGGVKHRFVNAGSGVFRFLCLVTENGDKYGDND